jgi:uncharacterized membrane protein
MMEKYKIKRLMFLNVSSFLALLIAVYFNNIPLAIFGGVVHLKETAWTMYFNYLIYKENKTEQTN